MNISLPLVKVLKTDFEKLIISQELCSLLQQGNLYEFEQELHRALFSLYDKICEAAINFVSKTSGFVSAQKLKGEELGLKKLEFRKATLQLRTGTKINYDSLYAKVAPEEYNGSRHLSSLIWQSSLSCSPMYKSLSCLFSVLCPSFDVSKSLMNYQDIKANADRIRQVSLSLADECMENRETIQLDKGETLVPNWNEEKNDFYYEGDIIPEEKKIKLISDAIFIHVAEACGGGFIYWKNDKYNWMQNE